MQTQGAQDVGRPNQHVHVIVVADDLKAAQQCIATMPLCWERQGSFIASNDLAGVWRIDEEKFYRWLKHRQSLRDSATGQAILHPLGELFEDLTLIFIQGRTPTRRSLGGLLSSHVQTTRHVLKLRLLMPTSFTQYRAPAEDLAAQFIAMKEADQPPARRLLLGVTDISLDRPLDHDIDIDSGSGIDQILNPSTLPDLMQHLGPTDQAVPAFGIAISGFERIFADFFALVRDRGRGYLRELPWQRHPDAYSAAADPDIMRPLLNHVIMTRPHLRNLLHNQRIFRPGAPRLGVTPIMPCGFLDSPFRCVNYDPMTNRWLRGDYEQMIIRHEAQAKEVIPYASCDPLLTALFGVRTPMQFVG